MLMTASGRILFALGLLLIGWLQLKLWTGESGYQDSARLQERIAQQASINDQLTERNRMLAAEVRDLKVGNESVEEHARLDLGLIKPGEIFIQLPPLEAARADISNTDAADNDAADAAPPP